MLPLSCSARSSMARSAIGTAATSAWRSSSCTSPSVARRASRGGFGAPIVRDRMLSPPRSVGTPPADDIELSGKLCGLPLTKIGVVLGVNGERYLSHAHTAATLKHGRRPVELRLRHSD